MQNTVADWRIHCHTLLHYICVVWQCIHICIGVTSSIQYLVLYLYRQHIVFVLVAKCICLNAKPDHRPAGRHLASPTNGCHCCLCLFFKSKNVNNNKFNIVVIQYFVCFFRQCKRPFICQVRLACLCFIWEGFFFWTPGNCNPTVSNSEYN